MANVTPARSAKKHTRRQESISKCRSLPSLQLISDGSLDFTCPKCGLTNTLLPICLWCYQTTNPEQEPTNTPNKRVSWNIVSALTTRESPYGFTIADEPPLLSRPSISSPKTSAPSCEPQVRQVMGQINKADGSKPPSYQLESLVLAHSSLNGSDPRVAQGGTTSVPPTHLGDDKTSLDDQLSRFERGGDASTRYRAHTHRDDGEFNTSVAMVHPTPPCAPVKQIPALSASVLSTNSGAGSSSPRSSFSSSSRLLRLRSKSLFSLTHNSTTAASSSSSSPSTSTHSTPPPSATTNMINAAKALTKRISSTTLRVIDPSGAASVNRVSAVSEYDQHGLAIISDQESSNEKYGPLDQGEATVHSRILRRKKRLGGAPPPRASPTPPHPNTLKKRVSSATLNAPQPIAVSFMLGKRPETPESEKSLPSPVRVAVDGELGCSSLPQPTLDKGKEVIRVARGEDADRDAPVDDVSNSFASSNPQGDHIFPPVAEHPPTSEPPPMNPPASNAHASSPVSNSGSPRIGHPSRPYYSAIRKHCMSSPAPAVPSSQPTSFGQPVSLSGSPANSRPTSSSMGSHQHPPSSFVMQASSLTPFTRRPLSLGAAPMSAPAISNIMGTHSHTASVTSTSGTHGMSVFDMEEDVDNDVFLDDDAPEVSGAPSSYRSEGGRKSSSLSRAFGRGQKHSKRRTWSSGLFSGDNEGVVPPSSCASRIGGSGRRASNGAPPPPSLNLDRIGISMSGETELRMSLAMMEQQERAQREQQQQHKESSIIDSMVLGSHDAHTPVQSASHAHSNQKFRFRQTVDCSQQQALSSDEGNLGVRRDSKAEQHAALAGSQPSTGVFARVRKLRKGFIKGFLGTSSANGGPMAQSIG